MLLFEASETQLGLNNGIRDTVSALSHTAATILHSSPLTGATIQERHLLETLICPCEDD